MREYAWERLKVLEFWNKILEVYYSVFTAVLSVVGVMEGASFIALPSACLTVAVAIIVCFANAQNYSRRAHDLEANISDLSIFLSKLSSLVECGKYENFVEEFYKKCGDSERPSLVDRYKYECFNNKEVRCSVRVIYYSILIAYGLVIFALFTLPIFVLRMWPEEFLTLLYQLKKI